MKATSPNSEAVMVHEVVFIALLFSEVKVIEKSKPLKRSSMKMLQTLFSGDRQSSNEKINEKIDADSIGVESLHIEENNLDFPSSDAALSNNIF